MDTTHQPLTILLPMFIVALLLSLELRAAERHESFDKDPQWDHHNNRSLVPEPRTIQQDFGYSTTHHAGGGAAGEIGGFTTPAAEPAYYAKKISPATFGETLTASGTLAATGRQFHVLLGFFRADTLNEWRTPNTIALRLYGRGDLFYAFVEYATSRWRAGGDSPGGFRTVRDPETGRDQLQGYPSRGAVHRWSLRYDPDGNNGYGSITATIDDETAICHLEPGHKQDGAMFDHFGLVSLPKHADSGGELWLDDITINGQTEEFSADPAWDAFQNRRTYVTHNVRPRFDFGYSPTPFAGGKHKGELGGHIFRGDIRDPQKVAYYGDRLATLTLNKPLRAGGKVALRRAISDTTVLVGFFHAAQSVAVIDSQSSGIPKNFLGAAIEGPSRDGFFFYPIYRTSEDESGWDSNPDRPPIYPDGASHDWSLEYSPEGAEGRGRITVTLDAKSTSLDLAPGARTDGTQLNRFGIVTTWIDGNGQYVYLDDLTYTCRQD